jgi:ethanolamine utilization protein EutA
MTGDAHREQWTTELRRAREGIAWALDNVVLITVGVDIGSSTSHLTFSRLWLQRERQLLSSRFVVVRRETLSQSPIILTPYEANGLIDVGALSIFIGDAYRAAGLDRSEVDTGAVILTGVALERANSRAIADLFSRDSGKFVCATAGHILEAILAAHGSGAVDLARRDRTTILSIDVGGGTTKLALIVEGRIEATMAIGVGARLVSLSETGKVVRVEPHGKIIAEAAEIDVAIGQTLSLADRLTLGRVMAGYIVTAAQGRWSSQGPPSLWLAGAIPIGATPAAISFSGGVAEFIYGRESRDFGDLAGELGRAIVDQANDLPARIVSGREGIRATVMGASQYTVQLSGNTVFVTNPASLPLRNIPVVRLSESGPEPLEAERIAASICDAGTTLGLDDIAGPIAIAVPWSVTPRHATLYALASGLLTAHRKRNRGSAPLIVALQGDVAASLGRLIALEFEAPEELIVLDGLDLAPLDYLDVGEVVEPAKVVPVIIKSLVFPTTNV